MKFRSSRMTAGFSLVEIVIAVGVLTFAVVSVVGLLPVGLTSLRQSMNQTIEAQIVRSIGAQAVTAAFTNLSRTNYYDSDGQVVPSTDAGVYYTANINASNKPVFPGSSLSPYLTNSLACLTIKLVARQNPAAPGTTNLYAIQVANAGK